jgi:hypothetical protein
MLASAIKLAAMPEVECVASSHRDVGPSANEVRSARPGCGTARHGE